MWKVNKFFEEIQKSKNSFVASNDGNEFEKALIRLLDRFQVIQFLNDSAAKLQGNKNVSEDISKNLKKDIKLIENEWQKLKKDVICKNSVELIKNPWPLLNNHYIHQPFGSQEYPDFLFFIGKYILPVEIKYSKAKKSKEKQNLEVIRPMWNSNIPKGNSIYIFGVATKNVTFFKGSDILDSNTRIALNKFFDDLGAKDENQIDLNSKMNEYLKGLENPFGFKPYVRRAFEQNKTFSTSFDDHGKQYIESYFSDKSLDRENEVINFTKSLLTEND